MYSDVKRISTLKARVLKPPTIVEGGTLMNFDIYTKKSMEVMQKAQSLALEHQNQYLDN